MRTSTIERGAGPSARRLAATAATALLASVLLALPPLGAPAEADGPSMGFYLAPPFVQTPKYSAAMEDFNGLTAGAGTSPTTWAGVSTADGVVGDWTVNGGGVKALYGGATTTAPTNPGDAQSSEEAATRSVFASIATGDSLSITLATPGSCFGFWWSAGDGGNAVELYTDGGTTLVASLTTAGVVTILNGGVGDVTAQDGDTYPAADYYGHPVSGGGARATSSEPFAYVHAIADGGIEFDRLVLKHGVGGGFEFDNLAVGTGCDVDAKYVTIDDDVLDETFAASLAVPAPAPPSLDCTPDPVVPGGTVTCAITGGDPNIDILWRASLDGAFASQGVTLDGMGRGTFSFVAPAGAAGRSIAVELVDWGVSDAVAVTGQVRPSTLPAGGGWDGTSTGTLLGALLTLALVVSGRLRASRASA